MKNMVMKILIVLVTASCWLTCHAEQKRVNDQLGVQLIKVEHPGKIDSSKGRQVNPQELLHDQNNRLIQYPVTHISIGSTVTNNFTKPVIIGARFKNIDGKPMGEIVTRNVGLSLIASVSKCESEIADLKLNFIFERQKGYEQVSEDESEGITFPKFETVNVDVNIGSAPLGSWIILGGLGEESTDNSYFYIVRISRLNDLKSTPLPLLLNSFERAKKSNQQVDPIVTTPVDEVDAQSTQGHP